MIALLRRPGALAAQPWFARDALRTAASWAGMADSAVDAALAELAARPARGELEALAAGAHRSPPAHDRPVDREAARRDAGMDARRRRALRARRGARPRRDRRRRAASLLDEAARACGSRPFATGRRLDRARRDLELFLLQHRLDPLLAARRRGVRSEER